MRKPSSRWVRVPVGLLFVMAGVLGFLPVLGLWMLVPGLLLLSLDVPALRPLVRAAIVYTSRWLHRRRLRRRMRRR